MLVFKNEDDGKTYMIEPCENSLFKFYTVYKRDKDGITYNPKPLYEGVYSNINEAFEDFVEWLNDQYIAFEEQGGDWEG